VGQFYFGETPRKVGQHSTGVDILRADVLRPTNRNPASAALSLKNVYSAPQDSGVGRQPVHAVQEDKVLALTVLVIVRDICGCHAKRDCRGSKGPRLDQKTTSGWERSAFVGSALSWPADRASRGLSRLAGRSGVF
jgi:hypothetical protein